MQVFFLDFWLNTCVFEILLVLLHNNLYLYEI